jgi:hypothetical protein
VRIKPERCEGGKKVVAGFVMAWQFCHIGGMISVQISVASFAARI